MLDSAPAETAEAPPAQEPPKRRGGRPKGSLNRATKDVRIAAQRYTRRALTVIGPKGGTFDVDLAGTSRAIAALKACQDKQP